MITVTDYGQWMTPCRQDNIYVLNVGEKEHLDVDFVVENKGEKVRIHFSVCFLMGFSIIFFEVSFG